VAPTPNAIATATPTPNRPTTLSALAGGPISRAVERIEPIDDCREADRDRQNHHEDEANGAQANALGERQLGAHGAEQQGAANDRHDHEHGDAQDEDLGQRGRLHGEDRSEEDQLRRAGSRTVRRREVQEERGQAHGGAEHDARRNVATLDALHADHVHRRGADDAPADESGQRRHAREERPAPPAVATSVSA